jgi:hypothetical protein
MSWLWGGSDDAEVSVEPVEESSEVAAISTPCPENFVIILGAPGNYDERDTAHDKSWSHFFRLIQVAFNSSLVSKRPNECIHWFVYGSGYEERWRKDKNDPVLDTQRADANRYPDGYLHRIEEWINSKGHTFHNMGSVSEFTNGFSTMPEESLSRIWFSGHASDNNLWLHLQHNDAGQAVNRRDRMIEKDALKNAVNGKAKKDTGAISKFYGCNTSQVAESVSTQGLISEGAQNSINFAYIDSVEELFTGKILSGNHLVRIENGNASSKHAENPNWTRYGE